MQVKQSQYKICVHYVLRKYEMIEKLGRMFLSENLEQAVGPFIQRFARVNDLDATTRNLFPGFLWSVERGGHFSCAYPPGTDT